MARVRITQTRSTSGHAGVMRRTLLALGLRGREQTVEHEDTPQLRGMLHRVAHLVEVRAANGASPGTREGTGRSARQGSGGE
ncbi:MAG: 50S ribosomal protein L30 [Gemmatimonadetes bacterium]|nr:50S ribosomal protein L30 [Gemmatimonadota bacterium]